MRDETALGTSPPHFHVLKPLGQYVARANWVNGAKLANSAEERVVTLLA